MGCTHSKKNSKISSDKPVSRVYSTSASSKPKSVQLSFSTTSSELSSEIPEKEEKDSRAAAKKDMIAPTNKHHATCNHKEKASGDGDAHRNVDSINGLAPNPDPREAAKEAARAGSRETPHEAPRAKDNGDSREARKERRHRDRRRSRHPPQAINTFWDQEDQDFIVRKNIQRNQRRIHAMQDRDETDDTLFEVPMRMPEVDFTNQTAVVA